MYSEKNNASCSTQNQPTAVLSVCLNHRNKGGDLDTRTLEPLAHGTAVLHLLYQNVIRLCFFFSSHENHIFPPLLV